MPRARGKYFLAQYFILGLSSRRELPREPLRVNNWFGGDQIGEKPIIGREYFSNPNVNLGFYSKRREGVADVDPKVSSFKFLKFNQVMEPFVPIPGRPPRKVVIDRQRKLFASLDIEELLLELVRFHFKF